MRLGLIAAPVVLLVACQPEEPDIGATETGSATSLSTSSTEDSASSTTAEAPRCPWTYDNAGLYCAFPTEANAQIVGTVASQPVALNHAIFDVDPCSGACPWGYRVGVLLSAVPRARGQALPDGDYLLLSPTFGESGGFKESGRLAGLEVASEGACDLDPSWLAITDPDPPLGSDGQPLLVGALACEWPDGSLGGSLSATLCVAFPWDPPLPACE